MNVPLRLVATEETMKLGMVWQDQRDTLLHIGDVFRWPEMDIPDVRSEDGTGTIITPGRLAYGIVLPNWSIWWSTLIVGGELWDITGSPEGDMASFTVHPSIEIGGHGERDYWHGWIRNGELVSC